MLGMHFLGVEEDTPANAQQKSCKAHWKRMWEVDDTCKICDAHLRLNLVLS